MRALLAVIVFCAVSVVGIVAASATVKPNPPKQQKPTPPSSGSSGSSGSPTQTTVKTCSLYATSSRFGLSCVSGTGGRAKTVGEILGHYKSTSFCWDSRIPDAELADKYGYTPNSDAPYYLHNCITGLDLSRSMYRQPNESLTQKVIEIPAAAVDCPLNYRPFTADKPAGLCLMTNTPGEQQIVSNEQGKDGQIPGITLVTRPSTKVRTNEDVAYVDLARAAGGSAVLTPDTYLGGVRLWARLDGYRILPYGPGGTAKACNGSQDVGPDDTRATKPNACWWTYPQSSARQPQRTYPFRAEADWTVYYSLGKGHVNPTKLASFQKYFDQGQAVYDVQTLVIN